MGSYRLTGNASHLAEALRWCDTFTAHQVPVTTSTGEAGGFWGAGYPTSVPLDDGEIYLGDTGTAATALAICHELTTDERQRGRFLGAIEAYFRFVRGGCTKPGCGAARRGALPAPASGFVNASAGGALGCGFYRGHLSSCPYVIATATTGAAFASELLNIVGRRSATGAACAAMVRDALQYMSGLVSASNGTLPYVIDCAVPDWASWPLDTITYVTEGAAAAWLHGLGSGGSGGSGGGGSSGGGSGDGGGGDVPAPRDAPAVPVAATMDAIFNATAEWLLANQNAYGFWGSTAHAADLQRSPRVATMLSLQAAAAAPAAPDPRIAAALEKYVAFLLAHGDGSYGVKDILNTSGFVALALIDILRFGATFGTPKPEPDSEEAAGEDGAERQPVRTEPVRTEEK